MIDNPDGTRTYVDTLPDGSTIRVEPGRVGPLINHENNRTIEPPSWVQPDKVWSRVFVSCGDSKCSACPMCNYVLSDGRFKHWNESSYPDIDKLVAAKLDAIFEDA